jgi:hypothetical protein
MAKLLTHFLSLLSLLGAVFLTALWVRSYHTTDTLHYPTTYSECSFVSSTGHLWLHVTPRDEMDFFMRKSVRASAWVESIRPPLNWDATVRGAGAREWFGFGFQPSYRKEYPVRLQAIPTWLLVFLAWLLPLRWGMHLLHPKPPQTPDGDTEADAPTSLPSPAEKPPLTPPTSD